MNELDERISRRRSIFFVMYANHLITVGYNSDAYRKVILYVVEIANLPHRANDVPRSPIVNES